MPRTFSLFRLMLGITAFCLLCGLAANFPEASSVVGRVVAFFGPTIVIWLLIMRRSRQWFDATIVSVIGSVVGLVVSACVVLPILFHFQAWIGVTFEFLVFAALSVGSALGVLTLGRVGLADELRR
jgi:hypothetical protein